MMKEEKKGICRPARKLFAVMRELGTSYQIPIARSTISLESYVETVINYILYHMHYC